MFGTLVSTDFDQGTLEFVENPDHVAAVSRNLQVKMHIACMSCRSRKVRCSGGGGKCQRCVVMGLECVYPESQTQSKRRKANSRRASPDVSSECCYGREIESPMQTFKQVIQCNTRVPTRIMRDDSEPRSRDGGGKNGEELALGDMGDFTFDANCIDESLLMTWIMDTPVDKGLDGGSGSSTGCNATSTGDLDTSESSFSPRSRSGMVPSPSQLHELSTADTSFPSLPSLSATDSAGNLKLWEGPHAAHDEIAWTPVDSASEPLAPETWGKTRREQPGSSCHCLRSAIAFIERLVTKSATRENRIDLLLADVRSSINTLGVIMACETCADRVEQNMLLAVAARQISIICEKTTACLKGMQRRSLGNTDSSSQKKLSRDAPAGPVDVFVSTYRANRGESLRLIESLVAFQIAEFQQHVNTIKSRNHNRANQGQAEAAVE